MSSPEDEAQEEAPAGEARAKLQGLLDGLRTELGDDVVGSELRGGDLWVRVRSEAWRRTAEVCRHRLGLDYFCFLSGIDWMPSAPNPEEAAAAEPIDAGDDGDGSQAAVEPEPEPEAATPEPAAPEAGSAESGWETGAAGGETRFQVLARLYSVRDKVGVTLKADLDDEAPSVPSWTGVYRGADWHERETWEMFGFEFRGHPNLRHLYLPSQFEGFPLRKDFPLLSREVKPWPGLVDVEPMPEEAEPAPASPAGADAGAEGGAGQ